MAMQSQVGFGRGSGAPFGQHLVDVAEAQANPAFGTSLDLQPGQLRAERAASTELQRNAALFEREGRMEEFQRFVERDGSSFFGLETPADINAKAQNEVLPAVFDMINIGNYTTVGFLDELVRTGDVWEAFKQAGLEFTAALPGIEEWATSRGAKKRGYVDTDLPAMLFGEPTNDNGWRNTAVGLAMDMLLDPINLIPGGAILKGVTMGARAGRATRAGGVVADALRPVQDLFGTKFIADYQLKQLGEAGQAFIELEDAGIRMKEFDEVHVVEAMERMFAHFSPQERALMGLTGDQPEVFRQVIDSFHQKGLMDADRKQMLETFLFDPEDGTYFKHVERLWKEGLERGFFDPGPGRDFYIHGTKPMLETSKRANRKIFEERGVVSPFTRAQRDRTMKLDDMASAQSRKTTSQLDRVTPSLRHEKSLTELAFETEYDLAAITTKRTLEQTRATATQKFVQSVLNDPRISQRVGMDKWKTVDGEKVPLWTDRKLWTEYKEELLETAPDGYSVFEWKRPKWDPATEAFTSQKEIAGAYLLPTAIVERLDRAEDLFTNSVEMSKFWQTLHKFTGWWKGLATLSPGFQSRNGVGVLAINHLNGVGTSSPFPWKQGPAGFKGTPLLARHAQAMKLQVLGQSTPGGKLPRFIDGIADKMGIESWGSIKLNIKHPDTGKVMTDAELLEEANKWGVSQMATKIENSPQGFEAQLLGSFETELTEQAVQAGAVQGAKLEGGTRELLGDVASDLIEQAGSKGTFADNLKDNLRRGYGGTMRWNRDFGMMIENNGRLALWLDRVDKGASFAEARIATSMAHYDYRKLTDFEKKYMRGMLPFYAWMRFNTPRMFVSMLENPAAMSKIPKLDQALTSMADFKLSEAETPDYFSEIVAAQTPFFTSDKPIFATPDLPMMDMAKLNFTDIVSSMTPFAKLAIEQVPDRGTNLFLGGPLERYAGEESEELTGLPKRLQHAIETLLPPVGTFVTRPTRAYNRGGAEGFGLYAASQIGGVRLRAVDVPRALRGNKFRLSRLSREFKKRLKQEEERRGGNT